MTPPSWEDDGLHPHSFFFKGDNNETMSLQSINL